MRAPAGCGGLTAWRRKPTLVALTGRLAKVARGRGCFGQSESDWVALRAKVGMALRQTTGFVIGLLGLDWDLPDVSTLSHRQR